METTQAVRMQLFIELFFSGHLIIYKVYTKNNSRFEHDRISTSEHPSPFTRQAGLILAMRENPIKHVISLAREVKIVFSTREVSTFADRLEQIFVLSLSCCVLPTEK